MGRYNDVNVDEFFEETVDESNDTKAAKLIVRRICFNIEIPIIWNYI